MVTTESEAVATGDVEILRVKQHWGTFFWPAFWTLILLVLPPHGLFILPLVWLIWKFIKWQRTFIVLTRRRVYGQQGVISLTRLDLRLNKLESILFNTSLLGRLLGYGTVQFRGTGATHYVFRHMATAQDFKQAVDRQVDALG